MGGLLSICCGRKSSIGPPATRTHRNNGGRPGKGGSPTYDIRDPAYVTENHLGGCDGDCGGSNGGGDGAGGNDGGGNGGGGGDSGGGGGGGGCGGCGGCGGYGG